MIRQILPMIILAILFTACASTKNAGSEANSQESIDVTPDQVYPFKDLTPGDSLFAHIKKGYCFGTCPVYEIHIYNSGHTVLKGIQNIKLMGEHTTQLTENQMLAFIEKAKAINYFSMDDNYDNKHVTDLPSTTTSIVADGIRKQVHRRYDYPREIEAFEKLFSKLLESQKWSPGHPER